ncbi:MAG: hypothetical protein ACOX7K_09130 [Oscillospiraceae bacterium]|jgi:hypothetical protein
MRVPPYKEEIINAVVSAVFFIAQMILITIVFKKFYWKFCLIEIAILLIAEYFYGILNRAYELDQSGITVYWFGKFSRHYNWEEFESIRVATIKMRVSDYRRCLIFSKHALPKPLVKASYSWFERHPFSTLLFELTPERYEEFCEKFPDIKLEWESTY